MEVGRFASNLVLIIVAIVLVVSVALPILGAIELPEGIANGDAIESMLGIIPILLIVSVVMAVIYMFISRRE